MPSRAEKSRCRRLISKMEDFNFWPRFEAGAFLRWTGHPFRQGKQLAEGQKSTDVKRLLAAPPPLRQPIRIGGEGQIPREKRVVWLFRSTIWRRGGACTICSYGPPFIPSQAN